MALRPLPSIPPAAGVPAVAEMNRALDVLVALDPASLSGAGQAELLGQVQRLGHRLGEYRLRILAAAEKAKTAKRAGVADTSAWASRVTRVDARKSHGEVKLATGLEEHEATRQALAEGLLSEDHAEVILKATGRLPGALTDLDRRRVERHLVDKAAQVTPGVFHRAARRAIEHDTRAVDARENALVQSEEDRARALARLTWRDNHDGTITGQFTMPTYYGNLLGKIIHTMTAPRRINRTARPGAAVGVGTSGRGSRRIRCLG